MRCRGAHVNRVVRRLRRVAESPVAGHDHQLPAIQQICVVLAQIRDGLVGEGWYVLDADDAARRPDHPGHAGREIAASTAHVQCAHARLQVVLQILQRCAVLHRARARADAPRT